MQIRSVSLDRDADAIVALIRELTPTAVITADAWRHRASTRPARARHLGCVAEVDGELAGSLDVGLNWLAEDSETAFVGILVRHAHRRRGIGTALWQRAEAWVRELGSRSVLTRFHENEDGVRFARARGFREVRAGVLSAVDPREAASAGAPSVEVRPVAAFDPRQIQHVDETATADLFTGTLPEYRGRGLALAVKLASLRWAAARGVTRVFTSNDETNAPMLAVNRRLGYRPVGRGVEYLAEREGLSRERREHL
jgi:GNAT superfamily N-acetyltransferase